MLHVQKWIVKLLQVVLHFELCFTFGMNHDLSFPQDCDKKAKPIARMRNKSRH